MRTKRIALALAVFVALAAGSASATESVSFDGQWWSSHSEHDRLLLVEGEIDGGTTLCWAAYTAAVYETAAALRKQKWPKWPSKTRKTVENLMGESRHACSYSRPFGVYLNAVDSFYLSYPKRSAVPVGQILGCYNDHLEQAGHTDICVEHIPSP